eukprot:TRINITY_DN12494_c0_g1_i19.p9 TRINITY_DN12494_c0_g1~~TRINITY_DN12494_c0_g1_i19.p9  ORF type:complete len:111 (-),score=7.66 TRINITY_DN12494_c0_g1_i19:4659-4991(-)
MKTVDTLLSRHTTHKSILYKCLKSRVGIQTGGIVDVFSQQTEVLLNGLFMEKAFKYCSWVHVLSCCLCLKLKSPQPFQIVGLSGVKIERRACDGSVPESQRLRQHHAWYV